MAELTLEERLAHRDRVARLLDGYLRRLLASRDWAVAVHHDPLEDPYAWYLRLFGESRDYVALWFRVRERTLAVESYLMPPPQENAETLYLYLLKANHHLVGVKFGIGGEEETGVFLTAHVDVDRVDDEVLDEIVGKCWEAIEAHFATAMSIGFASTYRSGGARSGPAVDAR